MVSRTGDAIVQQGPADSQGLSAECRGPVASGVCPFHIKAEAGDALDKPKVLWIIRRGVCVGFLFPTVGAAAFGAVGDPEGSELPGPGWAVPGVSLAQPCLPRCFP